MSLSRRGPHPLSVLRRRREASAPEPGPALPPTLAADRYDTWLEHFFDCELSRIDAACADPAHRCLGLFRDLDADLWALLLTQQYELYPNIRALLPDVPDPGLQEIWNGASGAALAAQSAAFYRRLGERYAQHGGRPLGESRVLDFGCGWGRLTRLLARDVEPGRLFGCDPVEAILDQCRRDGVPATLGRTEFVPERLPFEESFDLVYAFSVFTHLSEAAHESCLRALHHSLAPGGLLVLTVRPPQYLAFAEPMRPELERLGADPVARLGEAHYMFAPHLADGALLQHDGGEITYGDTVVTARYIQERWSSRFELVATDLLLGDLHQVMLTLRRA